MSLEVFGDEGREPNLYDDMMTTLRSKGLLWECLCHFESSVGRPCRICGLTQEEYAFYRHILDRYVEFWNNGQTGQHWIVAATKAVQAVLAEPQSPS